MSCSDSKRCEIIDINNDDSGILQALTSKQKKNILENESNFLIEAEQLSTQDGWIRLLDVFYAGAVSKQVIDVAYYYLINFPKKHHAPFWSLYNLGLLKPHNEKIEWRDDEEISKKVQILVERESGFSPQSLNMKAAPYKRSSTKSTTSSINPSVPSFNSQNLEILSSKATTSLPTNLTALSFDRGKKEESIAFSFPQKFTGPLECKEVDSTSYSGLSIDGFLLTPCEEAFYFAIGTKLGEDMLLELFWNGTMRRRACNLFFKKAEALRERNIDCQKFFSLHKQGRLQPHVGAWDLNNKIGGREEDERVITTTKKVNIVKNGKVVTVEEEVTTEMCSQDHWNWVFGRGIYAFDH